MDKDKKEHLKAKPWGMQDVQIRTVEGTHAGAHLTEPS